MSEISEAISLLYSDMVKLGSGSDDYTRQILGSLPKREFDMVVDIGCGHVEKGREEA